jgi:hypothetical protein
LRFLTPEEVAERNRRSHATRLGTQQPPLPGGAHGEDRDPVFTPRRMRRASLTSLAAGFCAVPLALGLVIGLQWLLAQWIGVGLACLAGGAAAAALLWLTVDHFSLGGYNRRLRADLARRLQALGEIGFELRSADTYFVGLTHGADAGRRGGNRAHGETDDDVGFVHLGPDGLAYHGDRLTFTLDWSDIEAIELVPAGDGLPAALRRLRLTTGIGAPMETVTLMCREGDRLTRANRATHVLAAALERRWERRKPALAARLTVPDEARAGLASETYPAT